MGVLKKQRLGLKKVNNQILVLDLADVYVCSQHVFPANSHYPFKIPEFTFFICIFYSMSNNTNVIHVQVSSVGDAQRVPVHLMPCEIEHNGPAQVSQYFHATTKDRKQGTCI